MAGLKYKTMNRGERYIAPAAVLSLAVALGGAACGGAKPMCETGWTAHKFQGERNAVQGDQNTWQGYELITDLPQDAKERVDYTDPGGNRYVSTWIENDEAKDIVMRVGHIGTVIRTQIEAPEGSAICDEKPDTRFIKKDFLTALYEGATAPKGWQAEQPD
jgi:hypothetical protein